LRKKKHFPQYKEEEFPLIIPERPKRKNKNYWEEKAPLGRNLWIPDKRFRG